MDATHATLPHSFMMGVGQDGNDALPTTTTFVTTTLATTTSRAATTPSTVPDVVVLAAGDHEFSLLVDGGERRYLVYVPENLGADPAHVVMSLHGGGGSAPQLQGQIGLDVIADREGFITVYPEGVGVANLHTWNADEFCCGLAARTNVDDVGFLAMVLNDLGTRTPVDGVIVDDPRALYEGGEGPAFPGTNNAVVHYPAMNSLEAWAAANGCEDLAAEGEVVESEQGHTATRIEWQECPVSTVHLRLTGAGHGWPGTTAAFEAIVGPNNDVISASEELWAFAEEVLANRPGDNGSS